MIVCVCNRLNESACRDTAASGRCRTVGCMYRLHGHRIRCGKCLPVMTEILAMHAPDATPGGPLRRRAARSSPPPPRSARPSGFLLALTLPAVRLRPGLAQNDSKELGMTKALTGDPQVLEALNIALKGELTAINQYFLHARMLDDWGFAKRGQDEYEESIEEMEHADKLIKRILLLGGLPNLQDLGKLYIGENLKELIECDYRLELEGIAHYRKAIGICEAAKDYVSRDLLAEILEDEEEHQDHNRTELELIDRIGIENFGQSQI